MCFPPDALPPVPPLRGASVAHRDLVLTAADGTEFSAFEAMGENGDGAGVIILPDVRGLFRFYEELALRFAERGFDAIAIDYFGRTAGLGKRTNDWDFWPHVMEVTHEGLKADVAAAAGVLRTANPDRPLFTVGFCFGGSNSWHLAADALGLAGAIGFYGHPARPDWPVGAAPLTERTAEMECPLLILMAGLDEGIMEAVPAFETALQDGGATYDLVVYEDAPHSFFDRTYDEHATASADAWDRMLAFIEAHAT